MDQDEFPTKGNLIRTQHTLALARQGYVLLDQKRNVLIREVTALQGRLKELQIRTNNALKAAGAALIYANIEMGSDHIKHLANSIPQENTIHIRTRNIMGSEIPIIQYENVVGLEPHYSLADTSLTLDEACKRFNEVKELIIALAALENTVFRLTDNIRKTQKRANALQHIMIPRYETRLKFIQDALEERERDGFVRLKIGKKNG